MNREIDNEIIHRRQRGQSIRGIARDLGISRRRCARTIRLYQQARDQESVTPELPQPTKKRSSKLDDFEEASTSVPLSICGEWRRPVCMTT
ncbi:MAG: hypothetical protein OEN50_11375 [Deltaproteobacteria bacterium]|nr:hypothetical protein [Deltaproteobacteria bacterium]